MPRLELVDAGDTAELFVYGFIGQTWDGSGVSAKEIARALSKSKARSIRVSINSHGGSAFDGVAIYNALRSHPAKVTARIDGVAASSASLIAMAADVVEMPRGSFLMIHNPWTYAGGESKDLRQTADMLDKISGEFIGIYSSRSGLDAETVKDQLDAETWFTPAEAAASGYATAVDGEEVDAYACGSGAVFAGVDMPRNIFPDHIFETLRPAASAKPAPPPAENPSMDMEKLKSAHPELYASVVAQATEAASVSARAEGAKAERERISEIEEATVPGYEALAAKAKANPSMTGRDLAWEITQSIKARGSNYLAHRASDAAEIGDTGSNANPVAHETSAGAAENQRQSIISAMVGILDHTETHGE